MKLFIKNTLTLRSLTLVRDELLRLGLGGARIAISELDTSKDLTPIQYQQLRATLNHAGIEFVEDKRDRLIQAIKNSIIEVVYHYDEPLTSNLSAHLSKRLNLDYTYISNLFSERLNTTIEKFFILSKIERVKELLLSEGLTLTEAAFKMHYSSVAHLSNQFKKVTGLTTTQFKIQNNWKQVIRVNDRRIAHSTKL